MKKIIIFIIGSFLFSNIAAYASEVKVDSGQQTKVGLTVYSSNIALVRDTRKAELPTGVVNMYFKDIASSVMPETVMVRSLNRKDDLSVLEQDYEYDLLNKNRLLDKYVGKKVKLVTYNRDGNPERNVEATLLSNNDGPVYEIDGEIYTDYPGKIVLPSSGTGLYEEPMLVWKLDNRYGGEHLIEVEYLTSGISWSADYILALNDDYSSGDFSGWVSVDNRSGTEYSNATLQLIAGDVNRATSARGMMAFAERSADAESFKEESFFEYHLYTLDRPVTIGDRQKKQIGLLKASGIDVEKQLRVNSRSSIFTSKYGAQQQRQDVEVFIIFKNSKSNGLGDPVPGGTVRVYKEDREGRGQFIGEDRIGHVPEDGKIDIKVGNSFDITCSRIQTDYQKLYTGVYETEWEITLRNSKDKRVTVYVDETIPGDWKIVKSSHKYEKSSASTAEFKVELPENTEEKITYRVRVEH